jgi:hypothetical protein
MIRSAVAILTVVVLAAIATSCGLVCLLAANGGAPSDSCCQKHHSGSAPCGQKTVVQQCPDGVLARAKTVPVLDAASTPPVAALLLLPMPAAHDSASQRQPEMLTDSAGLFLRLCVLLI